MKRRPFVQGTSIRKQVLRQRRIYTGFSDMWQTLKEREDKRQAPEERRQPRFRAA
jgi:hypothetical protein